MGGRLRSVSDPHPHQVALQRRRAVDVGRADQGDPLPGESEDGAAVDGVHEADRLGDGKAPGGEDEVTAAQGADAPLDADIIAVYWQQDAANLYLRVDAAHEWAALTTCGDNDDCRSTLGFYWLPPGRTQATPLSRWGGTATYLGFGAAQLVELVYASNARLTGVTFSLYDGVSWVSMEFPADDLRVAERGPGR